MVFPPPTSSGASSHLTSLSRRGLPLLLSTNPHAAVGKWLLSTSALVAGMVHIGGVTRLTKSGLSMTDWKPLGSRPPMSDEEWAVEFDRYRTYPEWEQRQDMTVEDFKYIFYWEWGHRMLGRVVGVCFAVPWAYYTLKPKLSKIVIPPIPPGFQPRLAMLFCMGGTQGLVGWWMVRSGLGNDRRGDSREIRVSPYRLTAHLGMAAVTYSALVWTAMDVLSHDKDGKPRSGAKPQSDLIRWARGMSPAAMSHARILRVGAIGMTGVAFLTLLSGGFVAGNDAGCAYNTWPWMNAHNVDVDRWDDDEDGEYDDRRNIVPWEDLVDPNIYPVYKNLFENTAAVQFNHRTLGTTTALASVGLAAYGLLHPASRAAASSSASSLSSLARRTLPSTTPQARRGLALVGTAAASQMALGVATLVNCVPVPLAAAHQLGSLVVLTCGIYASHSLRYAAPKLVSGAASTAVRNAAPILGGTGVVAGVVAAKLA